MKVWLKGLAATIIAGVVIYWLTTGLHKQKPNEFSMVGTWGGSPDCRVVFYKDDGKEVEGDCDNASVKHHFRGTYDGVNSVKMTITRTDAKNCQAIAQGSITINDRNSVTFSQAGWNGCGVSTGSETQSWGRR